MALGEGRTAGFYGGKRNEALLSFPDFTKPLHLYTDASDQQLGATVVQDGKPLGFYTRKLNAA